VFKKKPLKLEPLGDQAVLVTLPDEAAVAPFAAAVRDSQPPWLVDVVAAYVAVAVYFDLNQVDYDGVAAALNGLRFASKSPPGRRHTIPCCYEFGPDLDLVAQTVKLDRDAVIRLHTGTAFTVYAIGFCPGFPYLGYLPSELCGVPRLEKPRVRVEPGSVGLTGRQTGIYPLPRPGGWNLIGRTPLELVNVEQGYFPLRAGDQLQFERIDDDEFERRKGERLPVF
jgi:inhibitor of KinA